MIEAEIKELMSAPNAVLKTAVLLARPEPAYQQDYTAAHRAVHASIAGRFTIGAIGLSDARRSNSNTAC